MSIVDMLRARQQELEAHKAIIDKELGDIAKALGAIETPPDGGEDGGPQLTGAAVTQYQHPMPVDDAIVIAVTNGCKAPQAILAHLRQRLGVHTTIASVRTRVSRLKDRGRLAHDGDGWIIPPSNADLLDL